MSRSYLLLSLFIALSLQCCRPSSSDNQTGYSTPGNDPPTTDSTAQGTADNNLNQDTAASSSGTDSVGNQPPMQGEVGSSGDFMIAAAESGLTEVKLSELALERSVTPKVKEFAQMMLKDHNTANVELTKLAQKKSVELPSSLCMECEATYNALSKQKGDAFDSVYMMLMIKDHKKAVEQFVFQSSRGSDEEIKKWAAQKVPTLQHHLNTAQVWRRPRNTSTAR